jgi:dihydropteroate synthase
MNNLIDLRRFMYRSASSVAGSIRLGSQLLPLYPPKVMAILNINEDSFYPGSRFITPSQVADQAKKSIQEGADILDLGAVSSRPGAAEVSPTVERDRLLMACETIRADWPDFPISIDTTRADVLQSLLPFKIQMVNDISGGEEDPALLDLVADNQLAYVLMHRRGNAKTMQSMTQYDDLMKSLLDFFIQKIAILREKKILDILLDPGVGFAKTKNQNFHLLRHLTLLQILDLPVLIGLSRKSFIWKSLDTTVDDALPGTSALHFFALEQGARILRVHDVKAARHMIQLWSNLQDTSDQ